MRVLIIGDFFLDKYWIGSVSRLSPEAPIPVVNIEEVKEFPGGAGNVRANLEALGVECISVRYPQQSLFAEPVKNRLMVGDIQIARWDENDFCWAANPGSIEVAARDVDAIVVADYNKGSITGDVVQTVWKLNKPTFVDTKRDPSQWLGVAAAMFPNAKEYKEYSHEYGLFPLVFEKRGVEGIRVVLNGTVAHDSPSLAQHARSVNGAGDTVLAATAYSWLTAHNCSRYSAKNSGWAVFAMHHYESMARFANAAAAVVCEKPYTATATLEEIYNVLRRSNHNKQSDPSANH